MSAPAGKITAWQSRSGRLHLRPACSGAGPRNRMRKVTVPREPCNPARHCRCLQTTMAPAEGKITMTRQAGPGAAGALTTTGLSARGRIEHEARAHGWKTSYCQVSRSLELTRGEQMVLVSFDRRHAVSLARVGRANGYEITGAGKLGQVIRVLRGARKPQLKIVSADNHESAFMIPACCDDPSPEVGPRFRSGQNSGQVIYCASCDTGWLTMGWTQADLDEYFADRHEVTS